MTPTASTRRLPCSAVDRGGRAFTGRHSTPAATASPWRRRQRLAAGPGEERVRRGHRLRNSIVTGRAPTGVLNAPSAGVPHPSIAARTPTSARTCSTCGITDAPLTRWPVARSPRIAHGQRGRRGAGGHQRRQGRVVLVDARHERAELARSNVSASASTVPPTVTGTSVPPAGGETVTVTVLVPDRPAGSVAFATATYVPSGVHSRARQGPAASISTTVAVEIPTCTSARHRRDRWPSTRTARSAAHTRARRAPPSRWTRPARGSRPVRRRGRRARPPRSRCPTRCGRGRRPRRTRPGCDPCPCRTSGRRRTSCTTRSGGRRPSCCRRPRCRWTRPSSSSTWTPSVLRGL